jgi:hypothetical protein
MQKWDYKTVRLDRKRLYIDGNEVASGSSFSTLPYLQQLGEQGWEMVTAVSESVCIGGGIGTEHGGIRWYFKRPKS